MDLEVREIPIQSRAMYNSRLKSYKQEVEKLEKDFVSIQIPSYLSTALDSLLNAPFQKPYCKTLLLHMTLYLQAVTQRLCALYVHLPLNQTLILAQTVLCRSSVLRPLKLIPSSYLNLRVMPVENGLRVFVLLLQIWPCLVIHKSLYSLT